MSRADLITALTTFKGSKWTKEMIEIHETPTNLVGYHGDVRQQKANIIIRRKHIGSASNDIGFLYNEETNAYDAIISDYDSGTYNQNFLDKLGTQYGTEVVKSVAKEQGITDIEFTTNKDGSVDFEIEVGAGDIYGSGSGISW